jgi:DNA polymerase III sliding clamp (beta) subunit (PCNA family)
MSRITYAGDGFTALVPRQVLDLFTVGKEQVSIEHRDQQVRVSAGNRSVIARELDAQFPRYQMLIAGADEGATVFAQFRRADLLGAFDTRAHQVRLQFRGDGTMQVSTGDDVGKVEQTIAASVSSHDELPFQIAANPTYLASILKGIESETVEFTASKPTKPMVFKAGDDYHLLMPVRLPG